MHSAALVNAIPIEDANQITQAATISRLISKMNLTQQTSHHVSPNRLPNQLVNQERGIRMLLQRDLLPQNRLGILQLK